MRAGLQRETPSVVQEQWFWNNIEAGASDIRAIEFSAIVSRTERILRI